MVVGKVVEGTLNLPKDYEFVSPLTKLPLKFTCTGPHMLARLLTNCFYGDVADLAMDIASVLRRQLAMIEAEMVHVRSFLDHNRPYSSPANYVPGTRRATSTGAFCHFGEEIAPDELEENLVRHLRRWAPYVGRFGLLVLELHTLPPELTAAPVRSAKAGCMSGSCVMNESSATATVAGRLGMILPRNVFHS